VDKDNHSLRVTMDQDLQASYLYSPGNEKCFSQFTEASLNKVHSYVNSYSSEAGVMVMEVKYKEAIPLYFQEILDRYQLQKTNFSKYCHFIGKYLLQRRQALTGNIYEFGPHAHAPHLLDRHRTPNYLSS
jgi:hypothetical protein